MKCRHTIIPIICLSALYILFRQYNVITYPSSPSNVIHYQEALAARNLEIVQVRGDGNCLFRSLSYHFHEGDDSHHADVRQKIVDYMSDRKNGFRASFLMYNIDKIRAFEMFKKKEMKENHGMEEEDDDEEYDEKEEEGVNEDGAVKEDGVQGSGQDRLSEEADPSVEDSTTHESSLEDNVNEDRVNEDEFQAYLRYMLTSGSWGDHLELAAASVVFGHTIVIYTYDYTSKELRTTNIGPEEATIIRLDYFSGVHYNAIVEMDFQPEVDEAPTSDISETGI